MIGRNGQGWAVTFADLSIILFMITAADLSSAGSAHKGAAHAFTPVETAEPIAIFRPGGATSLHAWLDGQPQDPRQRLTIIVRHTRDDPTEVLEEGLRLAGEAEDAGHTPRLIVDQAEQPDVAAFLAYDSDPETVARNLLVSGQDNNSKEHR